MIMMMWVHLQLIRFTCIANFTWELFQSELHAHSWWIGVMFANLGSRLQRLAGYMKSYLVEGLEGFIMYMSTIG